MIYVVTALYQEAHGFIRELELKKNTAYAPFEVFDNESAGIRLVVTGVGEIAAAAATAPTDAVAEIKKYKDLLDSGIITEEEFAAKKKQLMGI